MRQRSAESWEPLGAVERVAARVRGYRGYLEPHDRRASDRALRRFAVEHLDRAAGAVDAEAKESRASERAALHRVARALERTRDGLARARSACATFLDAPGPVDAQTLHALDGRIAESALALAVTAEGGDYLARDLAAELERLDRALRGRDGAMRITPPAGS